MDVLKSDRVRLCNMQQSVFAPGDVQRIKKEIAEHERAQSYRNGLYANRGAIMEGNARYEYVESKNRGPSRKVGKKIRMKIKKIKKQETTAIKCGKCLKPAFRLKGPLECS